jgi:TolB-like protein/DNA-binding winged helix-turn-helix (wHTH) protein/Flp pilus assembly protein TadD
MSALTQGFELEGLQVTPLTGEVSGPGGIAHLEPKVMAVLVLMAEHPGAVMAREDLVTHLWGSVFVSDDALTRCFYALRRHLSEAGGDNRYRELIETLPKRGYRLKAAIRPTTGSPNEAPGDDPAPPAVRSSRPWILAVAALAAIGVAVYLMGSSSIESPDAAPVHSIVVLPFLDMSAEKDQGYFADGVTEEILNRLAQSRDLRVIARTSSFALRDKALNVPQIAERLDVGYVLEGSVRRSGERVRVTAQLIDASTNAHVWSDTYDRDLGDVLAVQDNIAVAVASELNASLAGSKVPFAPPEAEAYERYLHARFFYNRRGPGDLELMAQYLEEAVAIDPGFAKAWADLAGAYYLLGYENPDTQANWFVKRGRAALKAVELDPGLAAAHVRLAQHYWQTGDPARGDVHWHKAVELDSNDVLLLSMRAGDALTDGDLEQAVQLQRQAVARDPLSAVAHNNLGSFLTATGDYEEALAELRIRYELNPAKDPEHDAAIVRVLVLLERFDEASATIAGMPEGESRDFALALLYQAPGRQAEAEAALRRLSTRPSTTGALLLAEAYAQRGMNDRAAELLRKVHGSIGKDSVNDYAQRYDMRQLLHASPFMRQFRSDSRWNALISELDS